VDFGRRRLGIRTRLIVSVRGIHYRRVMSLPPGALLYGIQAMNPSRCLPVLVLVPATTVYGATRYDACQYLVRVRTRTRRGRAENFRTKIKMVAKNVGNEMKRSGGMAWGQGTNWLRVHATR